MINAIINWKWYWKVVAEPQKMPGFLASRGVEFNPGPEMRLDRSKLLCSKVLLKYKRDRKSFWHSHQKGDRECHPANVQFNSVTQSCPTLCDPINCSTPGLRVHHQLLEYTQTHIHLVGDAIQPSHSLSSSSPPAFNPSQQQGIFKWVSSSHQVAKILKFQLQHQSFQWTPRTDLL